MRSFIPITLFFFLPFSALGAAEVVTLDNGLRVILEELHFSPSVVVMVQYGVGARNESADISGISHFTEHMMFNGTENMPGQRFWQLVQRNGGRANGGTGSDNTSYFVYFPAAKLEEGLRMEADRMQNCLMDSAAIAQEIGVVIDEWRLSQDSPGHALYSEADKNFYGNNPLAQSVLGTSETIAAFSEESVREYYETWYRPSNAILTVSGDFDRNEALSLIQEYFGEIPNEEAPVNNVPVITEWNYPPRVDFDFPAESDRFVLYFQGCETTSPDFPALLLLSYYFSMERIGWIEENLVNTGLLTSGYASSPWGLDCRPFEIFGNVQNGIQADSVIELITARAYRLAEEPIDEELLSVLQDYITGSEVMNANTPLRIAYRSASDLSLFGHTGAYSEILEEIAALTPENIQAVAGEYFTPGRLMVTVLHAAEGGSVAGRTSTEGTTAVTVPEVTDWSGLDLDTDGFQLPEHSVSQGVERFSLANGLVLLVKEDHSFPIVEIVVTLPMSDRRAEADMAGISSLTAELMLRGTDELDNEAFHERLASKGSSIWLTPDVVCTMGNVYGHSDHIETYFTSLSDILMRPALDEDDFQSVREREAGNFSMLNEQPFSRFYRGLYAILLEEGNSRSADSSSIQNVSYTDAVNWWKTCVRPQGTVIAVVGDITPAQALELTEEYLGDWENPSDSLPELLEYHFSTAPGDTTVNSMPGKVQVVEAIACRGPAYESEDYSAFSAMSRILGGGIGSRLGQNIRETQGLAYAVGSSFEDPSSSFSSGSVFFSYLSTGAPLARRALDAILFECTRIAADGVFNEEVLLDRSRTLGQHALSFDNYYSVAEYLAITETRNLPLTRDIDYLEKTLSVDAEDIQRVAQEYFTGEWFVSVAGGVDENMEPLE
jgi:zinc protease